MQPSRHAAWQFTAGVLTLLLAVWYASQLLAPPEPDSGGDFSATSAYRVLERLAGPSLPHPVGSAENAALRERLVAEFRGLGLQVEVQSALACREAWAVCGFVNNVIARVPGTSGQPSVLMTAHYDSVGAGPGIADDLAGVAALLEVARLTGGSGEINPLLFVISDAEEVGLLGAEAFTRHPAFSDVALVVNVEARGTTGQSLLFESGGNPAWLVQAFAEEASLPVTSSLYHAIYSALPNDTDFSVYLEAGLSGLNFAAIGGSRAYHTPLDNLDNLSLATLQHHGDNLLAAARAFGNADLNDLPQGDAVFMTTAKGTVHQLPVAWAFYLALATLVFWFVAAARLLSTGLLPTSSLITGTVYSLAAILLAAVLGQSITWLLPRLTGSLAPWWAEPQWALAAIVMVSLTAVTVAGLIGTRHSSPWGLALGVWLWFALASFLLLEYLPGASAPFLVPATVTSFLLGFLALSTLRSWPWLLTIAACGSLFVAASTWLPLTWNLQQAMGIEIGAGIAACTALACLGLLPLLAGLPRRSPLLGGSVLIGLVATVVFLVLAVRAPRFSPAAPQFVDILHFELAEDGAVQQSSWLLDNIPFTPVPLGLHEILDLEPGPRAPLPWTGWLFHSAPATRAVTEFPSVTVLDWQQDLLRIRLHSHRGGDQLHLFLDAEAGLQEIRVPGSDHVIDYRGLAAGNRAQFSCHSPECDGLELELLLTGDAPLNVLVADQLPGLPEGGLDLQLARGDSAVPWQDGDVSLAVNSLFLVP